MTSFWSAVMGNCFFILIFFIQFCDVYCACKEVEDRKDDSYDPIAKLSFSPDDDIFAVNSWFNINCTGIKSDSATTEDKYLIPNQISIFINEVINRSICSHAKKGNQAVKTCVQRVNKNKIEALEVACQVQNDYGCTKQTIHINIKEKEKPYLTEQPPRHINVTEGLDLNMSCVSPVIPRSTITWYKDDVIITQHSITWFRGRSVLMLLSIYPSSQGKYVCNASNALGEIVSNSTFVTVFTRPRISLGPVNQSVAIGNRVSMVCNVTGLPIPLIGWLKDGVELGNGNGTGSDDVALSNSNSSVDVGNILPNMTSATIQAAYLTNTSSTVTRSIYRSIPPRITAASHIIPTNTGPILPTSTVTGPILPTNTLTGPILPISTVTGPILPTSTVPGPILPTSTVTEPTSLTQPPFPGKITQIGRQSTLVIDSVTKDEEGKYQCYARNAIANATSLRALLLVDISVKPRFIVSPRKVTVLAGFNATMNCTAVGYPVPNITWYENMLPITKERRSVVTKDNTSVLTVTSTVRQDQGAYSCRAQNVLGTLYSAQASLYVQDVYQENASSKSSRTTNPVIPILGTVLPLLLIIMIVLLIIIKKKRTKQQQHATMTVHKEEIGGIRNEGLNEQEFSDDLVYLLLMGIDRDWEIPRDRLSLTNQRLGDGCFGQVDKGIYTRKDNKEMFVAIKTLKDPEIQFQRDDVLAELEMLKRVRRHPNIVSLVGACTREEPLCIIIEFVEGGNLNELLLKSRLPQNRESAYENIRSRLYDSDLVKLAADVARGMKHLHDKNCIHRDLATRNILIGKGLVAKIADFGLARHVTDGLYVKQSAGKVPWKWMAPESLQGLFTTKSDVWSFGILLWEIATLGDLPYRGVTQLVALYNLLLSGYRMSKPPHCDQLLYSAMMDCWSADANTRPGFGDIYKMLEKMLNQKERIYINIEEMELDHRF